MNFFDTLKPLDNLGYNHSYEDYEYQLKLIKRAQAGDKQALEELIIINKRLILAIAKDNSYLTDDFDDLVHEGIEGFIKAVFKFDTSSNTKLSTYIVPAIQNKISNYIIRDTCKISTPRRKTQKIKAYKKARIKLLQQLNKEPTIQEISDYLGFDINSTYELYNLIANEPISLNSLINGEDTELGDLQEDILATNPLEEIKKNITLTNLLKLLLTSELTNKEIIVLILRNKTNSNKLTLNEIGKIYGVTRERIRQIKENAINKIYLNPYILDFLDFTKDADFIKRRLSINLFIQNNPFSNTYPDFYSYFPEYTEEEIDNIILNLSKIDLRFIKDLDNLPKYNASEKEKLFRLIMKIYDELFKKYKRRPLITPDYIFKSIKVNPSYTLSREEKEKLKTIYIEINLLKNAPLLREEHNLYDRFPKYTKKEVKRALIYISKEEYEFLQEKYGEDFTKKGNTKYSEFSRSDTKKIISICTEMESIIEKFRNNEPILYDIYTYFDMYSTDLIDIALNEVSLSEFRLLKKRLGPHLKTPYKEEELTRLTKNELSRLNAIIKKLSIKLEELSKEMGKNYKKKQRRLLATSLT